MHLCERHADDVQPVAVLEVDHLARGMTYHSEKEDIVRQVLIRLSVLTGDGARTVRTTSLPGAIRCAVDGGHREFRGAADVGTDYGRVRSDTPSGASR